MNIGKIPYHVFPSIGSAFSASSGTRVSLPVTPSSYIYSQFRHVSGVPAPEGTQGISLSEIQILDSLITEIVRLNEQPKQDFSIQNQDPEYRFNAIIENLQKQVSQAQTANASAPYPAANPDIGIMFSLSV